MKFYLTMRKIQRAEQRPATGHATKTRRMIQRSEKQGFFAIAENM
jgi:hypothetical protein